jgi:hypothetical protein
MKTAHPTTKTAKLKSKRRTPKDLSRQASLNDISNCGAPATTLRGRSMEESPMKLLRERVTNRVFAKSAIAAVGCILALYYGLEWVGARRLKDQIRF